MNLNLVGQQVVVFGAAGGIGRAIAAAFAEEGCRVVGFDLAEPELGEGAEDIEWIVGDVVNQKDLSQVEATMSDVDHVVFAAGAGSGVAGSPFWKIDPLDWSRVIKINLLGCSQRGTRVRPSNGAAQKRDLHIFGFRCRSDRLSD